MASLNVIRERSVRPNPVPTKTVQLTVRVTEQEAIAVAQAAQARGATVAAYMRTRIVPPTMPNL